MSLTALWCLALSSFWTCSAAANQRCFLHDLIARCAFRISNITVDTEAIVNVCHEPTDVTFNVTAIRSTWRHTFAATNGAESRPVASAEGSTLTLHVVMAEGDAVHLDIAAGYSWQSQHEILWFLNDSLLTLPRKEACFGEEDAANDATVAGLVTVLLLSAVCGMAAFVWKQHRQQKLLEQATALDDANAYLGAVGSHASDEEPRSPLVRRIPDGLVLQNLTARSHCCETVV